MYKLNEEKMFYDYADGQAVVINYQTGMYYGMSLLGSAILDRIVAGKNVDEIISAVKALPQCPPDIAERVHGFIKELQENEVIVKGPTVSGGAEPLAKEVAEDGFDLKLDMFAEMSDLLLADPVHDVDMNVGWPKLKDK